MKLGVEDALQKMCSKCKELKDLSGFYKNYKSKDGLSYQCKACQKVYHQSQHIKDQKKAYAASDIGREAVKRAATKYKTSEKGKKSNREWKKTDAGKACVNKSSARYREKHKEKLKSHWALKSAIKKGDVIRPDLCSLCGASGIIDGHHEDYSKPLDVIWVCRQCHADIHNGKVSL